MTTKQVGQKNSNGKTTTVNFCNVFYECIKKKSGICSLLTMFIGDDWMVDLMIIYIEKATPKALNINDIIKFLWRCQLDESKSLNKWSNSTTYWNLKMK